MDGVKAIEKISLLPCPYPILALEQDMEMDFKQLHLPLLLFTLLGQLNPCLCLALCIFASGISS